MGSGKVNGVVYSLAPGEHGLRLSEHAGVVSWLGMTSGRIDCHVYVLDGGDRGIVLVDAGTPWGRGRIERNMEHWGWDPARVAAVLLTHWHVDHASGAHLWQGQGAEIIAHPSAQRDAAGGYAGDSGVQEALPRWKADLPVRGGERICRCGFEIEIFHTPGHTEGCLSYRIRVDGAMWLFTGDVVMSNARPGWKGQWNRERLIATLARLSELEFDHLGHGHDVLLNDRGGLFRKALALSREDPSW